MKHLRGNAILDTLQLIAVFDSHERIQASQLPLK
jgi:hypothetical protein